MVSEERREQIKERFGEDYYNLDKKAKMSRRTIIYQREDKDNKIKEYKASFYKHKKLCELCNCEIQLSVFSRHKKTLKHIRNLKENVDKDE